MSSAAEVLSASGLATRRVEEAVSIDGARSAYLHAGQLLVSAAPTRITTILGSCVAICIWDAFSGVGGMNHFMLPYDSPANALSPRYARHATATLLVDAGIAGARLSRLQAKIFGGACILQAFRHADGHDLGTLNVQVAREMLASARIAVVDEDVGGTSGRKLVYRTDTGAATVTRLSK